MEQYPLQRSNKAAITTGESKIIKKKGFLFNLLKFSLSGVYLMNVNPFKGKGKKKIDSGGRHSFSTQSQHSLTLFRKHMYT